MNIYFSIALGCLSALFALVFGVVKALNSTDDVGLLMACTTIALGVAAVVSVGKLIGVVVQASNVAKDINIDLGTSFTASDVLNGKVSKYFRSLNKETENHRK